MKSLFKKSLYILAMSGLMSAAVSAENNIPEPKKSGSTDQIFREIMLTLPQEKQNEVKSANQIMEQKGLSEKNIEAVRSEMMERKNQAIDELPAEVKEKVEKSISENEKNMEERRLQLKELKNGNN